MKTKRRMRYLALFIASVVAFIMFPTNLLGVNATTEHPFVDDGRNNQTANDGLCDYCGGVASELQHTTSSSTSTVTVVESSEESKPGISKEEQKRLDDEAKAAKIIEFFRKNSRVRKGGVFVTSTLPGAYEASLVGGLAVTTPKDEAEKKVNIKNGENLTVQTWDVNEKKSPEAYRTLLNAPLVIGREVCSAVQININKEANGKIEKLDSSQGSVEVVVGVPEKAQNNGDEFVVAQVVEGGKTIIMADKDNDPETVTFDASYGDAAYGLIKAPIYRPYKSNNSEHYFTLSELEADEQIYKVYNPNNSKHQFTSSER
ncbi:MAG: hypothetical protein J5525_01770 [Lachnospiraceae bacterium]|nr:hypothetical protein [Lachnospiraceae bacterium]